MRKWDVYIADVSFEDLPQSKLRPVIILDDSVVLVECLKMTSHAPRFGEYALKHWKSAGLLTETTVRVSKRLLLPPNALRKRLGALHPIDVIEIEKLLV